VNTVKTVITVRSLSAALAFALALALTLALQPSTVPSLSAQAQEGPRGADAVRARYTKYEYRIPMRDGIKLFTAVYIPKDAAPDKTYPLLLSRTPYSVGPYGVDHYPPRVGPSEAAMKEGFIFVNQDVRGRFMSEGTFVDLRPHIPKKATPTTVDESTDTYDTIDWLVKNVPDNNGKAGVYGISYPGFYAAMALPDAHPALKAVSPQAPVADCYMGDDCYHGGAFMMPHNFGFFLFFKPQPEPTTKFPERTDLGTLDGYKFFLDIGTLPNLVRKFKPQTKEFLNDILAHETYDAYWQARNVRPHLTRITPAVLTVGGWFDAEDLAGALGVYKAIEKQNPANTSNQLVMGPWRHGGWSRGAGSSLGDITFGQDTAPFYQEQIELPFFKFHLKGGDAPKLPEAYVFETGRNQWRTFDTWPPAQTKTLAFYLSARGALSATAPTDARDAFDEYVSDPSKPVPFVEELTTDMPATYMVADQRFVSRRPDVLVYQTPPLEDDLPVAGPITATLHVSTTGTDADFVVKVIDVYPDDYPLLPEEQRNNATRSRMGGYQQLVRGEPFRGKFRRSFEKPEPFVPGQPTQVEFTMPDVLHTFRRGHRLMVQVQSSWFPLVNMNPQTFGKISEATEAAFQKATQRVWRTSASPSAIRLSVLGPETGPRPAPAKSTAPN
jgi:putative CocE/NonD family hydrolase